MSKTINCPKCNKETILNKDGMIRMHFRRMQKQISDNPRNYCIASGKSYEKLTTRLQVKPKQRDQLQNKPISARQMQVLDLLIKGFSHKETGYILNISHRTVDNHVAQMKKLLKISDRYELLRWGMKQLSA